MLLCYCLQSYFKRFFLYIAFVYTIFIEIWLIHVHSRPHQCRPCLQLSFDSVNLFLFRSCSTLIQIDFKISSFRAIFKYFSIYISNYERRKKMVCVCINWINKLFSVIWRWKTHQNRRKKPHWIYHVDEMIENEQQFIRIRKSEESLLMTTNNMYPKKPHKAHTVSRTIN